MYYRATLPIMMISLVLSLLLCSCSSVSSLMGGRHKYDYAQNFEAMQHYNFGPLSNTLQADQNFAFIQAAGARLAIENGMARKKIIKESHLPPDMWLNYYFTGEQLISVEQLNKRFNYNLGLAWDDKYGSGQGIANGAYQFAKRSLIIDLISAKHNRLIWRGSVVTAIRSDDSDAEKRRALDEAVKVILAPFPPENQFSSLKKPVFDE